MAIIAEKREGDFQKVNPGMYVARCYSMIEIGTITTEFNGETKKAHKVAITWELPTELAVFNKDKGEEPYVVTKTYTLSMHEKSTLRKDLESWRGKGYTDEEARRFDITKLLGVPCNLNVIHVPGKDNKTYVQVASISPLMKGQTCPDQINQTRVLSFDEFNWDVFNSLSDYMKDKIKSSEEFQMLEEPQTTRVEEEFVVGDNNFMSDSRKAKMTNKNPNDLPF